ncbi:MAG TPA: HAD hydrolase family protein [Candidatus Thermoplasmatota archaeon]|nr:HAD hydrolase family protein [Candidatus Thermoplasmatota archaeon]
MTETPSPAARQPIAFAVDCDRTLTGEDLVPDPEALFAIAALREAGIPCVLVTGRAKEDLERFSTIADSFDAYALEGGAVWGPWNTLLRPSNVDIVLKAADRVAEAGIEVERRSASFSVAIKDLQVLQEKAADCSLQTNIDRVDVLPPGLDKGTGLDGALGSLGIRAAHVVAIGDGENDIPLFDRSNVALAVANAVPALKEIADEILAEAGPKGVVDAAHRLLKGEWRTDPPVPPAAA